MILSRLWRVLSPALQQNLTIPISAKSHYEAAEVTASTKAESTYPTQRNVEALPRLRVNVSTIKVATPALSSQTAIKTESGSCYCYCGYDQAIGQCINSASSRQDCMAFHNSSSAAQSVGAYCPQASLWLDCASPNISSTCPPAVYETMVLDEERPATLCDAGNPPVGPFMQDMQCHYKPVAFDACFWVPNSTCVTDSPYFPVLGL